MVGTGLMKKHFAYTVSRINRLPSALLSRFPVIKSACCLNADAGMPMNRPAAAGEMNPTGRILCQMMRYSKKQPSKALYEAILSLKNLDECERFFEDLCTENELRSMEQRYNVAAYLMQDMVYADILERTGASSATISRVRRNILNHGSVMTEIIARQQEKD